MFIFIYQLEKLGGGKNILFKIYTMPFYSQNYETMVIRIKKKMIRKYLKVARSKEI